MQRSAPKGSVQAVRLENVFGALGCQRELIAALRHARNKRAPRNKGQDRRGQIPDMRSIHLRPPEIEDRQFPGHWEGDLTKGRPTPGPWAPWWSAPAVW